MSAMPAEAEPPQASTAPRQTGAGPRLASTRPRQAGLRPYPTGLRTHPTGMRACSYVMRAEPPSAAPPAPEVTTDRPAESRRLRLTRRGRVVLIVAAAVVASLLGFAAASAAQASDHGVSPRPAGRSVSQIVVQPGQTLWSIAVRTDPSADPRLVVQRIVSINALTGENIAAGQRLWVPQG